MASSSRAERRLRRTEMSYACEYESKCSGGKDCTLKFQRLWVITCEKWAVFFREEQIRAVPITHRRER